MTASTTQQLDRLIALWLDNHNYALPSIEYDEAWPSQCYLNASTSQGETTQWKPVLQSEPHDMFERLAEALDVEIHPSIIEVYSRYWSDPISLTAPAGKLSLLQVWNAEDMERLRANMIGHAMAKKQQKQPLSLFFACTEPDDGMLTVRNEDGSVWLEYPGKKPVKKIADSLSEFLASLTL